MSEQILSSWKEIAAYLGKGVRTVQRWEVELELPVRRPAPGAKHVVLAFPAELDDWVKNGKVRESAAEEPARQTQGTVSLRMRNHELRQRMNVLVQTTLERSKRSYEQAQKLVDQHKEAGRNSPPPRRHSRV
jgi:hypothetical protein